MPDTALTSRLDDVLAHLDSDLDHALERLFHLMRCRSISTDPAYDHECEKAADWLASDLAAMGFEARVCPTGGQPMVVGHSLKGEGPHILFYGHYDVQPVDPLDLWDRDPFDPQVLARDDGSRYISGRGSSDDKGQLMTFLEACRAWKTVAGGLPCKVTILMEGEEESGGKSLPPFLESHKEELKADIAVVCDTSMWDAETPAVTTMLRGMMTDEIIVHAASRDLHSGAYGSAAANPIRVLTRLLAALHDDQNKVQIPDFYEGVPEIPAEIRAGWDMLGFDADAFLGEIGLSVPAGETDRTALEQIWARPTCEFNGIIGGYTGEGFKTVIPAKASAKISCRLVGTQDPVKIRENLRAFLTERLPADCRAEFIAHGQGGATVMPTDAPAFGKAKTALSEEWGKDAHFIGAGGSIPVVADFHKILGMDTMLIGFALEDDRIHSPNEKYELRSFHKGTRSFARLLAAMGG